MNTPGPWTFRGATGEGHVIATLASNGASINTCLFEITTATPNRPRNDEQVDNARLLASAPELMEALADILNLHTLGIFKEADGVSLEGSDWPERLAKAHAALARSPYYNR